MSEAWHDFWRRKLDPNVRRDRRNEAAGEGNRAARSGNLGVPYEALGSGLPRQAVLPCSPLTASSFRPRSSSKGEGIPGNFCIFRVIRHEMVDLYKTLLYMYL